MNRNNIKLSLILTVIVALVVSTTYAITVITTETYSKTTISLEKEIDIEPQPREVSPERIEEGYARTSMLVGKLQEEGSEYRRGAENFVPFTTIAYYPDEDAIKVGIHKDYVNSASMKKYADIVRGIVGDGVNIVIYNGGGYARLS